MIARSSSILPLSLLPLSMLLLAAEAPASGAEAPPVAELSWRRGIGRLGVTAPPGEHIDPRSPVRVVVDQADRHQELDAHGDVLVDGWRFPVAEGELAGTLRLALCEDGGGTCRVVDLQFTAAVSGRRGAVSLALEDAAPATVEPHPEPGFAEDPDRAFAEALARASSRDHAVLLDFGAIWCPPCNLLAAQVLEDPADADALAGYEVVSIDADRPDSWALKDRYDVGGYPTVIITDAAGNERDRQVGYTSEAAFLQWLDRAGRPEPVDPLVRADRLARTGRIVAARGILAEIPPVADDLRYRRVALMVADEPDPADVAWLVAHEHSRERALQWIWDVIDVAASDPGLAAATRSFLLAQTVGAPPLEASDLLVAVARLTEDEDAARAIYGAAAAVLAAGLSGDPVRDKGLYGALADLYEEAGLRDAAIDLLVDAVAAFPDEMTFHYALAGAWIDAGRPDEAVAQARRALAVSYGDNRLRSAHRLAEALAAAGRVDEAVGVIDEALAGAVVPPDDVQVRTPRYLEALRRLRGELAGE
ncbi:MAG: hypothetical protein D6798_08925 [Deltaproteobacteria bacterium]|nr:MAG: hypothetical protein D6798_08925 [Deltaproteobacteria bacterium]